MKTITLDAKTEAMINAYEAQAVKYVVYETYEKYTERKAAEKAQAEKMHQKP